MAGGEQDGAKKEILPEVSIARLPSVDARIFGRGADTAWLDACWAEGANVASIVAFGGVGKSALVWDWLRGMQKDDWRGADRVFGWSFYSQGTTDRMTSADEFVSAALRWFSDPDPNAGSPWDKGERLAGLVRRQRVLLVLDGVEPLQWGPGPQEGKIRDPALSTLVRELGAQNAGLCVITSRLKVPEAEELSAEKCRRLDLSTLAEEAGAALLRARGVTEGTEEELRETVREYGGHGLALALLGSYLEEVGEGDVRRRHEIGLLQEDERLGGHARRVMAAYEKMLGGGSAEVAILRMLGLFDRPADDGEIKALREHPPIAGLTVTLAEVREHEWNKAIARLRRVGLLVPSTGQDESLDAHPLVREHFGVQLQRSYPDAWREGHRRLYEHLKGKAKELPETLPEMAPLYSAVVHGCRAGRGNEVIELFWKRIHVGDAWFTRGRLGAYDIELVVLSAFFTKPWEQLVPELDPLKQASVLSNVGFNLMVLGQLLEAEKLIKKALRLYQADEMSGSTMLKARSAAIGTGHLARLCEDRGRLEDALGYARESVRFAQESGDQFWLIVRKTTLASMLHQTGRHQALTEARAQFIHAEQLQKTFNPGFPLLRSHQGFWYCEFLLDEGLELDVLQRAAQTYRWAESEKGVTDIGLNHLSLGRANLLAVLRGTGGDLTVAAYHLNCAVDSLRRAQDHGYSPRGLLARAALRTHTRACDLARKDLDEAHSIATHCGYRLHEADAHVGYARLALAEGGPTAALGHLATARKIVDQTGYHRRDGELAELTAEADKMAKAPALPTAAPAQVPSPPPAPGPPVQQAPVTAPQPSSVTVTSPADHKGKVDFAILTIRDDEFQAVLDRFPPFTRAKGRRVYNLHRLNLAAGGSYLVAVLKCIEQGNVEALDAARDVLEELEPRWVLVVGIAGGVPSDELTLGDVVVSTRIVDFSVEAVLQDKPSEYALMGGPVAKEAAVVLADLRALAGELGAWGSAASIGAARPPIEIDGGEFYGDDAWQKKARAGLARQAARTEPIVIAGAIGSSDRLVKDTKIFATFLLKAARQVLAVEMESAGVYRAAIGRGVPLVAIRGLSDVVGFKRDPGWTAYACHTAAAFTRAFLRTRPIEPRAVEHTAPGQQASALATRWPAKLSGAEVQELVSALLGAFPSRSALAQMVRVGLDENLDAIASPGNLRATIFEVVGHAEAQGLVPGLFDAALAAVPGNPELRALAAKQQAHGTVNIDAGGAPVSQLVPQPRAAASPPQNRGGVMSAEDASSKGNVWDALRGGKKADTSTTKSLEDIAAEVGRQQAEQEREAQRSLDDNEKFVDALPTIVEDVIKPILNRIATTLRDKAKLKAEVTVGEEIVRIIGGRTQLDGCANSLITLKFTIPPHPDWRRVGAFIGMAPVVFVAPFMRGMIMMYAADPRPGCGQDYVLCGEFDRDTANAETIGPLLDGVVRKMIAHAPLAALKR